MADVGILIAQEEHLEPRRKDAEMAARRPFVDKGRTGGFRNGSA